MNNLHPMFARICKAFGAPIDNGDLHDKGTDRLLSDLDQPHIVTEAERLTGELFPDRAARLAADKNADATARPFGVPYRSARTDAALSIDASGVEEVERFDEFTGPFADESGTSAGAGGVA